MCNDTLQVMGGLQGESVRIANTHRVKAYLAELGLGMDQVELGKVPVGQNSRYGENAYINCPSPCDK